MFRTGGFLALSEDGKMASEPTNSPVAAAVTRGIAQPVTAPLARAAIFLVVTVNPGNDNRATVRSFCGDLAGLLRAVGFRDIEAGLSCVLGVGSEAWDRLFGTPRPAELHPFREIRSGDRHAVATPGDLLFHIRARRFDLCFELATQIMIRLGNAVTAVDEVHGFRNFDERDLLGFVDGTENPTGQEAIDSVVIGDEDLQFAGGSYVIVQNIFTIWQDGMRFPPRRRNASSAREAVGHRVDDSVKPTSAHNALTTIVQDGKRSRSCVTTCPSDGCRR